MRILSFAVVGSFVAMAIACGGAGNSPPPSGLPPAASAAGASGNAPLVSDTTTDSETAPTESIARSEPPETELERKYYIRMRSKNLDVLHPATMSVGNLGTITAPVHVQQIVSDGVMLCRCDDQMFLLSGFNTRGTVDDRNISIADSVVAVTGTQSYTTVLGATKTVFVVQAVNTDRMDAKLREEEWNDREKAIALEEANRQRLAAEEREQKEAHRVAVTRMWKTSDGLFTVDAEFVSKVGVRVKLRRTDNAKEVFVEIERLSDEDRKWLEDRSTKLQK